MKFIIFVLLIILTQSAQAKVQVLSKTLKEATHFELSGLNEWRYDVSRGDQFIEVQIQGISKEEIEKLMGFKDSRIRKISIKTGINNSALIRFDTATKISFFDYQTDSPATLVFDFFSSQPKPKPLSKKVTLGEFVAKKEPTAVKSKRSIASLDDKKIQVGYQPPILSQKETQKADESKYTNLDLADKEYKRFIVQDYEINPDAYLKLEQEVNLKFPPLYLKVSPNEKDLDNNKTEFKIETEDNEENKIVRLMFKLYEERNYAVVIRTMKFFREKFPISKYDELLHLFKADLHYSLWKRDNKNIDFETALGLYKEHAVRYPESVYKDKINYLIAISLFNKKLYIEALNHLQSVVKNSESSSYYWPLRILMANSFRALKQSESALAELEYIEKNNEKLAPMARFARGDVYFKLEQNEKALSEYSQAIKKYPNSQKEAVNSYFNIAEINFQKADYKTALNDFRYFVKNYPDNEHTSYAMGRIAKILEILGVDDERVLKANLETYYRFKDTPASYFSKVKINLSRAALMKPKEAHQVIQEIKSEAPESDVEGAKDFALFSVAEMHLERKEYDQALAIYNKFYKENIHSPLLKLAKNKIHKLMTVEMKDMLESKKEMQVIQYYLKQKDEWLKDYQRVDTDYIVGTAYEKIHLYDDANKFYEKALSKFKSLNALDEKRRKLFEYSLNQEQLNLRIAKAYFKQENIKRAAEHVENIKDEATLKPDERVEYNVVKAAVNEKQAKYDVAIFELKKLCDVWQGKPELLLEPYLRISKIYSTQKNMPEALQWSNKAVGLIQQSNFENLNKDLVKETLKYAAELEIKNNNPQKAIAIYKQLIEKFSPTQAPLASIKYSLGKIYFDQNDIKGAEQVWSQLKEEKDAALWIKMADENLAQLKWSEKLKKYVRKPSGEQK